MSFFKPDAKIVLFGKGIPAARAAALLFLFFFVMAAVWLGSRYYVLHKAERDIETMLLQHKGVHHYVQRNTHPELYSLKTRREIPDALYTPVLFSSSYMVRNMHNYYNEEREKAGLSRLYYKMAAINPRNPVNRASEFEAELIRMFNSSREHSGYYRSIIRIEGREYLYVAIPFLRNEQRCLKCHGRYEDSPRQLQALYPGRGGFNEKIGYIRAIESLRAPLTGELALPYIALSSASVVFIVIVSLFFMNRRLSSLVSERTKVIERQAWSLQKSEEWLRITLDSIAEGVIATDMESRIVRMNPVAEELTGWTGSGAEGMNLEEVFCIRDWVNPDSKEDPAGEDSEKGNASLLYDRKIMTSRDGTERVISENRAPILSDNGYTVGTALVFRDLTGHVELERQLIQSRKMDAIGRLAGGIAHDFNNMLGGIIGASEVLALRIGADDKNRKFINILLNSAKSAAALTSRLLVFSRENNFESKTVSVHRAVNDAVLLLERSIDKRIVISLDLAAEHSDCSGNGAQLENLFLNLGINAADAMPEGGKLEYRSRVVDLDENYCSSTKLNLKPGPYIVVEVQDNGKGMSSEKLSRIFEPFFTTKAEGCGTGLGLASVYATAKQHGGAVTVYSEEGAGTIFHVSLPLVFDSKAEEIHHEAVPGTGTVLVVDDEEAIRITAGGILTGLGYDVLTAADGYEALEIFSRKSDEIDLVLLDMIMPRMNGTQCFREMRKIRPHIPVIISSGFTDGLNPALVRDDDLCVFIRKPYYTSDLSRAAASLLGG